MKRSRQKSATEPVVAFFRVLAFSSVLFLGHRLTSFHIMADEFPGLDGTHLAQSFLVGAASDLWAATFLALAALVAYAAAAPFEVTRRIVHWTTVAGLSTLALLIVAHQGYVEFYRAPIMAFHLRYLADLEFMQSSTTTAWSPMVAANVAASLLAAWVATRPLNPPGNHHRAVVATLLVATTIHVLQIRYRVQWFVPGPLQFNALEKIVTDLASQTIVPLPSEGELARYSALRARATNPHPLQLEFRQRLRDAFQQKVREGRKPVIAVMALETFRPSETGSYRETESGGPTPAVNLTPEFDHLAKSGVLFRNAWSSGTITCAGQEALWCGQPSGMLTSLMRVQTQKNVSCVPDEVALDGGRSMWIHNGQGKFDNQASFWARHGVNRIITAADFPADTPGGSWGLSDLALATKAAEEIASARAHSEGTFIAPFILTVTNHIPWDLPSDAPQDISNMTAPRGQNERMWRTTAYTDAAIGIFASQARRLGFWDDLILILAADHGNLEPGKHPTTTPNVNGESQDIPARRQSHITLLLTGGLTESVPREFGEIRSATGQTGVAALVRWISATTAPQNPQPDLLSWPIDWPVLSDQNGNVLVAPATGTSGEKMIPRSWLARDLAKDPIVSEQDGSTALNDAAIVFKGSQAPLANKPGSRAAD